MRSIKSFSRARTTERGIVLIAALTLAILYFALMELLLVDSSRELAEANRFRAVVVAGVLAENAAELAALQMVRGAGPPVQEADQQGTMSGQMRRGAGEYFEIVGQGETTGVLKQVATVFVQGRVDENGIVKIDYTKHGQ